MEEQENGVLLSSINAIQHKLDTVINTVTTIQLEQVRYDLRLQQVEVKVNGILDSKKHGLQTILDNMIKTIVGAAIAVCLAKIGLSI